MDSEGVKITQACDNVNSAKARKACICTVGTTSMRAVESSVSSQNTLNPFAMVGQINLFSSSRIYDSNLYDAIFTLLNLLLLMMVSAFFGHDLMKKAYAEAIEEQYKFYSYGDAMLII
jgi:S-adenosylmethionine:tRNA ribosyltransferase-isomerase